MQRPQVRTPEILWHGGNEKGKTNPVFAVDVLPSAAGVLVTAGTDGSVPPRGCARVSM
jgi:hypothetical protein